jgi:hypothetical protein
MSNMEFVLRFTLSHRGTSNPVHLASNIAVAERGPPPADLYEEAKNRLPLPGRPLTRNRRRQLCMTITGRG